MFSALIFFVRTILVWVASVILFATLIFRGIFQSGVPSDTGILLLIVGGVVAMAALAHIRRVRLIDQSLSFGNMANRHRRQIELPLDANEAFDLLDSSIRELPGIDQIDSASSSLQVRAKIKRAHTYHTELMQTWTRLEWLASGDNQIFATVSPELDSCRVTIICEPIRQSWTDWFVLDNASNLENVQTISRIIFRRIAEYRKREKDGVKQTITEKELTVAKLKLLHAQVEPHFLYNTLANAQILTRTDPAKAEQMLGNLITYLRHSLPRTEDAPSAIGIEVERVCAYLDIMRIRMGSRLQVQVEMPEHIKTILFPSMMLQTLVENAIKHGLEPQSGGGTIWILVRTHDQYLTVTVADDGRGFGAQGGGTGIGLRNIRERLNLTYGAAASFGIVANFPSGVAATISVPIHFIQGAQHA
jgi:signal transduction histidine kinase